MTTRLIQRMALRLLSAGVFSFYALSAAPVSAGEVDPGKARLEAIKVELALLSDASAYTQPLTVRVHGGGVEVQGTVASEAVRQRVLEIARRSCYLPIHDRIALAGDVARASAPLIKSAHDRLVRELGAQADGIKIQPEASKLKLSGQVRSVEDKLHASRTLRGLPGCGGLINNLEVKADAGPSFTLVTHASDDAPVAPVATPPAPVATLPSGLPPARVVPVQAETLDRWESPTHSAPPVLPPVAAKKPAPVAAEPKLAPVVLAPVVVQTSTPSLTEWPPAHRTGLVTPLPAGALYQSHPLGNLNRPQVAAQELKPVAVTMPVAETKPEVVKTVEVVKKPVAPKPATGDLIRKVKAASGSYARDVRVETGADGVLAIHVYATAGGEQMLTTKLFDVPELTQSNVRLHVHLAK